MFGNALPLLSLSLPSVNYNVNVSVNDMLNYSKKKDIQNYVTFRSNNKKKFDINRFESFIKQKYNLNTKLEIFKFFSSVYDLLEMTYDNISQKF